MNARRVITWIVTGLSILLVLKLVLDRRKPSVAIENEQPAEVADRPAPDVPIRYALGEIDPRFGISRERYLDLAREAESVWEQASGKTLFEYDPNAPMKLNLVFDWRQEKLLAAKEAKGKLDAGGNSFDELQADYDARSKEFDRLKRECDGAAGRYRTASEEYAGRVTRWNESTSHPEEVYSELQSIKKGLDDDRAELERRTRELNARGEELNKFGERLKDLAKEFNLEVENFNGAFVQSRDFEKGAYDGTAINVYEFEQESDLKVTLIHEFGHALGLGHVENPKAIMARKLAVQDLEDIRLTPDDLKLLAEKIK